MSLIRCGCQTGEQYNSCDLTRDRKELSWLDCSAHCERFFSEGIMFYKPWKVCSCSDVPSKGCQTLINRGHDVMTCMI